MIYQNQETHPNSFRESMGVPDGYAPMIDGEEEEPA